MYKITAEVTRRTVKVVVVSTLGPPVIACWQAAAKKLDRKSDRLELWNTLFTTALHEDIWEDVRLVSCSPSGNSLLPRYVLIHIRRFSITRTRGRLLKSNYNTRSYSRPRSQRTKGH
jgi:hypothetical protein